jgi:hypothetical protein
MRARLVACCPCFETLASLAPQHEVVVFQQVRPHPCVTASPLSLEEALNGSRECAPDDRLRAVSKDGLQYRFVIPGTGSIADARQDRLEGDAGQLQRGAFEVDHVAVRRSLQGQRHHVGSEQRLETRIVMVALGRDLDVDFVASAGVVPDEGKARIAAAQFARNGIDHAIAGAMNGMKLNPV